MFFLLSPRKPPFLLCFFLYCLKNGWFLPTVTTTEACVIPCMNMPETKAIEFKKNSILANVTRHQKVVSLMDDPILQSKSCSQLPVASCLDLHLEQNFSILYHSLKILSYILRGKEGDLDFIRP